MKKVDRPLGATLDNREFEIEDYFWRIRMEEHWGSGSRWYAYDLFSFVYHTSSTTVSYTDISRSKHHGGLPLSHVNLHFSRISALGSYNVI